MKTWSRTLGCVALAAVVAGLAAAQTREQQKVPAQLGGRIVVSGQLRLLENADVQKDLKLSAEQVKKIGEIAQKQKEATKDLKPREDLAKVREAAEAAAKAVGETLTDTQKNRLKQLELQQRGLQGFMFERTGARDLGITDEQRTKIQELTKESLAKMREILRGAGNRDEATKKNAEATKALQAEILKVLTPEQQKKWRESTGEPFQGTFPANMFPGVRALPEGAIPNIRRKKDDK